MIQSALTRLDLSGRPTTPRLRLLSADQSEGLWQWLEPGEHASAVTFAAQGEDLAGQMQPALDRALALRPPGTSQMVLPLLIESDAPLHRDAAARHALVPVGGGAVARAGTAQLRRRLEQMQS